MKGFYISASGAIQGHRGPFVQQIPLFEIYFDNIIAFVYFCGKKKKTTNFNSSFCACCNGKFGLFPTLTTVNQSSTPISVGGDLSRLMAIVACLQNLLNRREYANEISHLKLPSTLLVRFNEDLAALVMILARCCCAPRVLRVSPTHCHYAFTTI